MEDPQFINYLRMGYVASQVITLLVYFYVTVLVSSRISSDARGWQGHVLTCILVDKEEERFDCSKICESEECNGTSSLNPTRMTKAMGKKTKLIWF